MTEVMLEAKCFKHQDLTWLQTEGIGLMTVDLDKVLADFNSPKVFPEAADQIAHSVENGTNVAVVTNRTDTERLSEISAQLPDIEVLYKGLDGMKGKPAPDMLLAAKERVKHGPAGPYSVHIDDQLKAWRSAIKADFNWFVGARPDGKLTDQHLGVALGRVAEVQVGFISISALNFYRGARDIYKGDWQELTY